MPNLYVSGAAIATEKKATSPVVTAGMSAHAVEIVSPKMKSTGLMMKHTVGIVFATVKYARNIIAKVI